MLGELTTEQSYQILQQEVVGRIGCHAEDRIYVVPVTYVFDGKSIYAHSKEGLKILAMRKNPSICFQVDRIDNMANWRSVIAWGKYEELKSEDQEMALKTLRDRLTPLLISESVKPSHGLQSPKIVVKPTKAVVFRISISEITGRFEKNGG